jgi:N-acetylglucosaminyl-diphospho-decaprenol L-rhamnosyltransferase
MTAHPTADKTESRSPRKAREQEPVVIAIVGYKNAEDLRLCLTALAASKEKNFIVSICENGGPASYRALKEALGGLVDFNDSPPALVDERVTEACSGRLRPGGQAVRIYGAMGNLGYAGGVNVSLRQLAPAESWSALWILNPDTEPRPEALGALIQRAREGGYDIVGSRLVQKATGRVQSYGGHWRWWIANGRSIGRNAAGDAVPNIEAVEREMNYISGASLYATRDYIETVGPMDERYFLYCEEVDWCLRRESRRLGYAHASIVIHSHGTTIGSHSDRRKRLPLSVYLDERNRHLLTRRFFPKCYPLVALATLLFTAQYLRARAGANFIVALSGWYSGLRGEEGLPERFRHSERAWKGK